MVEYLYMLDYEPLDIAPTEDASSSSNRGSSHGHSSDTMSVHTEAGQYGHMYGTSAVSAFGGPQSPFSGIFRNRTESTLTVHALPHSHFDGTLGRPENRRRKSNHTQSSPLATDAPCLILHATIYTAGHKYSIEGLKALALDKFKIQLTRHW